MPGIDETRPFFPVRIAVMTVSDTRTPDTDRSGDTLAQRIGGQAMFLPGAPSSPTISSRSAASFCAGFQTRKSTW